MRTKHGVDDRLVPVVMAELVLRGGMFGAKGQYDSDASIPNAKQVSEPTDPWERLPVTNHVVVQHLRPQLASGPFTDAWRHGAGRRSSGLGLAGGLHTRMDPAHGGLGPFARV
jgi:hypothetical protein